MQANGAWCGVAQYTRYSRAEVWILSMELQPCRSVSPASALQTIRQPAHPTVVVIGKAVKNLSEVFNFNNFIA